MYPTYIPTDGELVMGLFVQDSSSEAMIASAQGLRTRGRLSVAADAPINDKTILRRASDGFFFAVTSDPKTAPKQAVTQIKVYQAAITDRPEGYVEKDEGQVAKQ